MLYCIVLYCNISIHARLQFHVYIANVHLNCLQCLDNIYFIFGKLFFIKKKLFFTVTGYFNRNGPYTFDRLTNTHLDVNRF